MLNYFAILNDTQRQVKVVVDKRLLDANYASFHPMDNTGSTAINKQGILKIKELCGRDENDFIVHDFGAVAPLSEAKGAGKPKKEKAEKP